jgi:hypothetical protein
LEKLEKHLAAFPDISLETAGYTMAAQFFNTCRAKGVQGSYTGFLISAVGVSRQLATYTTDIERVRFLYSFVGFIIACLVITLQSTRFSSIASVALFRSPASCSLR